MPNKITISVIVFMLTFVFSIARADEAPEKSVKLLSVNVGNTNFNIRGLELEPTCPVYKLCNPRVMDRLRTHIVQHLPDVIFLQEALSLEQLTQHSPSARALLPPNYFAACGPGAGGIHEVCIAWNGRRAQLQGKSCTSLFSFDGGSLRCKIKVDGLVIDFVNLHPSFWSKPDRDLIVKATWEKLVTPENPTVIGGDFNNENETYGVQNDKPYPPNFGTLFGRMVKNYGRWPGPFDGYGTYASTTGKDLQFRSYWTSTLFIERLDHLFANFGEPMSKPPVRNMPCGQSSCFGNRDGYEWGGGEWDFFGPWGPNTDHFPMMVLLNWK